MTAERSWITRHPHWYIRERESLARHYPQLRVDEAQLARGNLVLYGALVVRPPGGTKHYPIALAYPVGTPYEHPMVLPLEKEPDWTAERGAAHLPTPRYFSRRHQMAAGNLCLFQRDTRTTGGDVISGIDVLTRAEKWFMALDTGRWPPDSVESELESHFLSAGHVLVADKFYGDQLGNYGRFFFMPDLRRLFEEPGRFAPFIITAVTKEDGVILTFDARAELASLYPWIESEAWNAGKEAAKTGYPQEDEGAANVPRLEHGYWVALENEPQPFRDGATLLEVLNPSAPGKDAWSFLKDTLVRGDLASSHLHFGLRYPGRNGGFEWLFLIMSKPEHKAGGGLLLTPHKVLREEFKRAEVACVSTHRLNPDVLWFRNTGIVDGGVRNKTVALIGLGALGSRVAELLAQAGITRFRLCDMDRLETGNVARHIGGVSDFGARKADVVLRRLRGINPYVDVGQGDMLYDPVASDLGRLAGFIESADLVVSTMADESAEAVLNEIALLARKPVLYGRAMRGATIGRVFLVRPGHDACKGCLAGFAATKRSSKDAPEAFIDVPEGKGILLHECGRPVIAGSGIDLSFIASLTARVAIDYLESRSVKHNHWIWVGVPAAEIDARLQPALSTVPLFMPPDPSCPICQEPAICEVALPEEVRKTILQEVAASPDAETGGILIGHVDGRRAMVLRATGPGPNAVRTKTLFRRDVAFAQAELDRAAEDFGDSGTYIGEWHSHLVPTVAPSATDVESLVGIAHAPHYLMRCPVMIIAGLDTTSQEVKEVRAWAFPVGGRAYPIKLVLAEHS